MAFFLSTNLGALLVNVLAFRRGPGCGLAPERPGYVASENMPLAILGTSITAKSFFG